MTKHNCDGGVVEAEFAQKTKAPIAFNIHNVAGYDILLNNFKINKKNYRVLLNCNHIVWESLDSKRNNGNEHNENTKKEIECETEQLSHKATYGGTSNVVHINEIIRATKGVSKSATLKTAQLHNVSANTLNDPTSVLSTTIQAQQSEQSQPLPPTEQYLTVHYALRLNNSPSDCNRWRVQTLTLYNADAYIVEQWHTMLITMLKNSSRMRVKRLLVFINPYGGRKQGLHVYERYCKPLFLLAGIDASCIISQRANQIRDILMSHNLAPFDAVCCVGGDGTVAEVINGLIFRAMRDLDMDMQLPKWIPKSALPIGIIPAGSTDTIAYSMHGTADVRTAAIHMVLGQTRGVDICSVRNRDGIVRFCASVLSYGYLGDTAAGSEKYRWMGTKRYEYTGFKTFLCNRGYEAEMRILLDNADDDVQNEQQIFARTTCSSNSNNSVVNNSSKDMICYANCKRCDSAASLPAAQIQNYDINHDNNSEDDDVCDDDVAEEIRLHSAHTTLDDRIATPAEEMDNCCNMMVHCDKDIKIEVAETQLQKDKQIKELLKCDNDSVGGDMAKQQTEISKEKIATGTMPKVSNHEATQNSFSSKGNSSSKCKKLNKTNNKWKTVKGSFFMISGANITCACSRSPNGISRYNHLGDGYLNLVLVRKTSFLNNIRLLTNTICRNGDIRNLPFVELYRTKKFHFRSTHAGTNDVYSVRGSCQPIAESFPADGTDNINVSSWNCDGEVLNDLEIVMTSHCQLIDVFMRGPNSYYKPVKSEEPATAISAATVPTRTFYCCA